MNDAIFIVIVDGVYAAIALIAWALGWYLTEKREPVLRVKPFNCRPCLTFWLTLMGCGIASAYMAQLNTLCNYDLTLYTMLTISLLVALINFYIIKSKFQIYE